MKEFSFDVLEKHRNLAPDTPAQAAPEEYAKKYVESRFPIGSSIYGATSILRRAGAKCTLSSDSKNNDHHYKNEYACRYIVHGFGLAYLFEQIEWVIIFYAGDDPNSIIAIDVFRYKTTL